MTDILRLATELERSGGLHRLTALINCAVRVAWEREHPTGAGMSDRTTFGGIVHAPDSPIPDLVREPSVGELAMSIAEARLEPLWSAVQQACEAREQRPVDPTIAAEDPA